MNIVLIGFKGSGKTTASKLAAKKSNMGFIDIDQVTEKIYYEKQKKKLPIRKIYEILGKESFRRLERESILSLNDINNTIIAAGGGTILDSENVDGLKKLGTLIYLQTPESIIKKRMIKGKTPSFLDPKDFSASFDNMYRARKNIYKNISSIVINTGNKTPEEIATKIIEVKNGK